MASPESHGPPKTALFIRLDSLGDHVLFSPALASIQAAWPATRIAVVIRRAHVGLATLLNPGVEWIETSIDPLAQGPADAAPEIERLRGIVADLAPDLVVAACAHRNWLETVLAARAADARRVAFHTTSEDAYFGAQLRLLLGATTAEVFTETAEEKPHPQDWERNYGLAEYLLGHPVAHAPPSLRLAPSLLSAADEVLRGLRLEPGKFLVCAAAGFANVAIKTWPSERYASVLKELRARRGSPALLIGGDNERTYLEALLDSAGPDAAALWTGGERELPLLAGLIARSAFFLGNDTGAIHLAAALDRPVVGLYGGGTWPRFLPAAKRAVLLVNPLPCFGCAWDCAFGDAPCVKAIGIQDVLSAVEDVAIRPDPQYFEVRSLRKIPEGVADLMGRASAQSRERGIALHARQQQLEELQAARGDLQAICGERQHELERLHAEYAQLQAVCEERLQLITRLDADLHRLLREAGQRESDIGALNTELAAARAALAGPARD